MERAPLMHYDVFISYCHRDGLALAVALELALETLGKRWDQVKALEVFRDLSDQGAASDLDEDLCRRMDVSEHFLLVASPEAAASEYVAQELAHWLEGHGPESVLLAVAVPDAAVDWGMLATMFPPLARRAAPKWTDFSGMEPDQLNTRDGTFLDKAAELAAAVRQVDKSDLIGEHARERKRIRARKMAQEATLVVEADARQGLILAREANGIEDSPQTRRGLVDVLTAAGHRIAELPCLPRASAAAFDASGRQLLLGDLGGTLRLIDAETGEQRTTLVHTDRGQVESVALDPRGERYAAFMSTETAIVGRLSGGEPTRYDLGAEPSPGTPRWAKPAPVVVFDPTGRHLGMAASGTLVIVDLDTSTIVRGPDAGAQHLRFHGEHLVALDDTRELSVDVETGRVVRERNLGRPAMTLSRHRVHSADRSVYADSSPYQLVNDPVTIHRADGARLASLDLTERVHGLALTSSGELVGVVHGDELTVWRINDGSPQVAYRTTGLPDPLYGLVLSDDARRAVTLHEDHVRLWTSDARNGLGRTVLRRWDHEVVPRSSDHHIDVSVRDDRVAWILDPTGESLGEPWPPGATVAVADSNGGTTTLSTSTARGVWLLPEGLVAVRSEGLGTWSLADGELVADPIELRSGEVVVATDDGLALVRRTKSGIVEVRHDGRVRSPGSGPLSGDWELAAIGHGCIAYADHRMDASYIEVWSLRDGLVAEMVVPFGGLALSDNASRLLLGVDGGIQVVQVATGESSDFVAVPRLRHAAISPDGTTVATLSSDGQVRLFDAFDQILFAVLHGEPRARVHRLEFSPDGSRLAEITDQAGLILWDVSPATWRTTALRLAGGDQAAVAVHEARDGAAMRRAPRPVQYYRTPESQRV